MNEDKPTPTYTVDDDTLNLLELALNCMIQLSEAQVDEAASENLVVIADEIALRFNISSVIQVEEDTSTDEVIYKPRGGLFNDDD